jgi:regulatory protein YycI of two-component signal transduction system YycFG
MRTKNITESERQRLYYQLLKLEYLTKRKAGQYVLLDTKNNRIVASGEQTKLDKTAKNKLLEKANPQEVIAFLKSLNNYLEKTENLNAKRSVLTLFE